jgi:hypothetical protein
MDRSSLAPNAPPTPDRVTRTISGGELGNPVQVKERLRPPYVEVDLDHDVGPARDRHRAGDLGLGRERVSERPGLQEFMLGYQLSFPGRWSRRTG